jgi:hypothetical protein
MVMYRRVVALIGALALVASCAPTPSQIPPTAAAVASTTPAPTPTTTPSEPQTSWIEAFAIEGGSLGAVIEGPHGLLAAGCLSDDAAVCSTRIVASAEASGTWHTVEVEGPADIRFESLYLVGERLLAVGYGHYGRAGGAVVWTSLDGRAWSRIRSPSLQGRAVDNILASPRGVLAIGYDAPIDSDNSTGFIVWPVHIAGSFGAERRVDAMRGPALVGNATWTGEEFLAWGYRDGPYVDGPTILLASRDGSAWTRRAEIAAANRGVVEGIVAVGDRLVAVGYEGRVFPLSPRAWTSMDSGRTWALAEVAGGPGAMYTVAFEGSTYVARGADVSGDNVRSLSWSSVDGTSWTLLPPDVDAPDIDGFSVRGRVTTLDRRCVSGTFFDASPAHSAIYCRANSSN